jgi:hypothetical protein
VQPSPAPAPRTRAGPTLTPGSTGCESWRTGRPPAQRSLITKRT